MDVFDKMLTALITALVGIIFLASVLVPIAAKQVEDVSKLGGEAAKYTTLLGVVITVSIVIVIVVLLRHFTSKSE